MSEVIDPKDPEAKEPVEPKQPEDPQEPKQPDKMFTRDDLAKITNAQVTQAIEKFKKESLPDLLNSKYAEGKEDAKLSAKELADKEAKEKQEKFERKEQELNQREAKLNTRNLLASKDVPEGMQDILLASIVKLDADKREDAVDTFNKAFQEAVHQGVLDKTAGKKTPQAGNPATTTITKEEFYKKSYAEQSKLLDDNPQLATQFGIN